MTNQNQDRPVVMTKAGRLTGTISKQNLCSSFKGIPYAAAPVGPLRWQPPQPVQPWEGLRPAESFGKRAIQRAAEFDLFINALVDGQGWNYFRRTMVKMMLKAAPKPPESEDCLFVNVWSPQLDSRAKLPVMVWYHGGNHQDGSSGDIFYDSDTLASQGVVTVTVNYRLGLMGYLAHPELSAESDHNVSGNYGTLDQIAALHWVQENISNFGGDPDNVTIFGQSGGGESVVQLMSSPLARGLFHKAIAQSPADSNQMIHLRKPFYENVAAEEQGRQFAAELGLGKNNQIEKMRQMSAAQLQETVRSDRKHGFFPNIDGYVLSDSPWGSFQSGAQAQVPFIVGACADEATLFREIFPLPDSDAALNGELPPFLKDGFADTAAELIEAYPGLRAGQPDAFIDFSGDNIFGSKASFFAHHHSEQGNPTFHYQFNRVPPSKKQRAGAYHSAELSFVHGKAIPLFPHNEKDRQLADHIQAYWIQFARSGQPAVQSSPEWPRYKADDPRWMVLGYDLGHRPVDRQHKFDLLNQRTMRLVSEMKELIASEKALAD